MLDTRAAGTSSCLRETDGALARRTLLQIASLPDAVAPDSKRMLRQS